MTLIVEASDLKKTYSLGKVPIEALRGITLKIESGDYIAVLGPSGSGKSTLMNLIGALDKPTSGKLLIEGIDVSTLDDSSLTNLRSKIGLVFQFFNLIPRLTARENVELSLAIAGVSNPKRRQRSQEMLRDFGLGDRMNHKPSELSGGQQQRVAIARALANDPRFLLMDEPTGNIDSKMASETMAIISSLNEQGVTVIMVTHDHQIAKQAKRTIQMSDGLIIADSVN